MSSEMVVLLSATAAMLAFAFLFTAVKAWPARDPRGHFLPGEFQRAFPGTCPLCSYARYARDHGMDLPPYPHDCVEAPRLGGSYRSPAPLGPYRPAARKKTARPLPKPGLSGLG